MEPKSEQAKEPTITTAVENLPFSMFRGNLKIGDMDMECHVLSDGRRVFTQREMVRVLSRGRESGNLSAYLERNPLITKEEVAGDEIRFKIPGNPTTAIGREATTLIEICEKYLDALDQGLLKGENRKKLQSQKLTIIKAIQRNMR